MLAQRERIGVPAGAPGIHDPVSARLFWRQLGGEGHDHDAIAEVSLHAANVDPSGGAYLGRTRAGGVSESDEEGGCGSRRVAFQAVSFQTLLLLAENFDLEGDSLCSESKAIPYQQEPGLSSTRHVQAAPDGDVVRNPGH